MSGFQLLSQLFQDLVETWVLLSDRFRVPLAVKSANSRHFRRRSTSSLFLLCHRFSNRQSRRSVLRRSGHTQAHERPDCSKHYTPPNLSTHRLHYRAQQQFYDIPFQEHECHLLGVDKTHGKHYRSLSLTIERQEFRQPKLSIFPDTMVEQAPPPGSSVAAHKASPPKRSRADSGSSTSIESKYVLFMAC